MAGCRRVYERPEIPPLRGCVNDVVLVRRVLKRYFGVPNDDIRVVVNARATKADPRSARRDDPKVPAGRCHGLLLLRPRLSDPRPSAPDDLRAIAPFRAELASWIETGRPPR
jgi:hypothetical protein